MRMWQILAIIAMFPATAQAESYYQFFGGVSILHDSDVSDATTTIPASFDPGVLLGAAVGTEFTELFRGDLELSLRWNGMDSLGGVSVGGNVTTTAWMANGYVGGTEGLYAGAGIGVANISLDISFAGVSLTNDRASGFAWQGIFGYARSGWMVEYRYFAADSLDFTDSAGVAFEADYRNSTILAGIRRTF